MVKQKPVKVDDVHISIVGHITCEELRRYLNATESGRPRLVCLPFFCADLLTPMLTIAR